MSKMIVNDPMDAIKVTHKNKPMSIYQLCEGDLIEVTLKENDGKKGATLRGLYVRRKAGTLITIQTTNSSRPIMIEWIYSINLLFPFFKN